MFQHVHGVGCTGLASADAIRVGTDPVTESSSPAVGGGEGGEAAGATPGGQTIDDTVHSQRATRVTLKVKVRSGQV